MSKELTEKIKAGYYYALLYQYDGEHPDDRDFEDIVLYDLNGQFTYMSCYDGVQEILAPVPSYQEYKETKHNKECLKLSRDKVVRLEAENNTLKEQLKEANGIIKGASHLTVRDKQNAIICELISPEINDYLERWNIK